MTYTVGQRIATLAFAAAAVLLAPEVARAQAPAKPYVPPRTPDGQPDISGMYEPGHIGQPAENPVGERWKPPQRTAPGRTIGPTDFGAREQADTDTTRVQIKPSNKPMVVDPPDGLFEL